MFKFLKDRKKKDKKGFTLVELVIVVAILAILVGLLAPQYTKYVERSRKAADASNLDSMVTAVKVATADQQYSAIIPASGTIDVVITMTKDKTEVKYNGVDITAKKGSDGNDITQTDGAVALGNAFKEYAGNEWTATTLKSKAWKDDQGTVTASISATCTISTSGSVEVEYSPANVKNTLKETNN